MSRLYFTQPVHSLMFFTVMNIFAKTKYLCEVQCEHNNKLSVTEFADVIISVIPNNVYLRQ